MESRKMAASKAIWAMLLLLAATLACKFVMGDNSGEAGSQPPPQEGEPAFSQITFCKDVTDEGECVSPSTSFPSGTEMVWGYFDYQNMQDGMRWGRLWQNDGEIYIDGRGETWGDGESGWQAYSIYGEEEPLEGEFSLTLYIGDEPVQEASFSVTPGSPVTISGEPAFGQITFGTGVTEAKTAVDTNTQFTSGITRVYASFPYQNIDPDQIWRREWLQNNEVIDQYEGAWGTPSEGITYVYFNDDQGLASGEYTLNLYLDRQLASSASFVVGLNLEGGRPVTSGKPEDLIDPEIMPAYEMLLNSDMRLLNLLAEMVTDKPVEMRMVDSLEGAIAAYARNTDTCYLDPSRRPPGMVLVNREEYNSQSWEEVAATIAHELTHAFQHLSGRGACETCSVEKEYEAFFVQISALEEMGRLDLAQAEFPGVVDDYGNIDGDKLWWAIKETYSHCPEY